MIDKVDKVEKELRKLSSSVNYDKKRASKKVGEVSVSQ